jgi:hypothetical protein
MPYMHIVDPFVSETGRDGYVVLLHIENERQESLDVGWWHIITV